MATPYLQCILTAEISAIKESCPLRCVIQSKGIGIIVIVPAITACLEVGILNILAHIHGLVGADVLLVVLTETLLQFIKCSLKLL